MTCIPSVHNLILQKLLQGLSELRARREYITAGDSRNLLVNPFLSYLGYPSVNRRSDFTGNHCRPDIILWTGPASLSEHQPSRIIIKTEKLGKDFDNVGHPPHRTPNEQSIRYLLEHPASGPNTLAVLTDGLVYRVFKRPADPDAAIETLGEWSIMAEPSPGKPAPIALLTNLLSNPGSGSAPY